MIDMRHYLLYVWSDVEPDILGPYRTETERDRNARRLRKEDPESRNGVFMLDITSRGEPRARAYSDGFFMDRRNDG